MKEKIDPRKMKDWEIAKIKEKNRRPIEEIAKKLQIKDDEMVKIKRVLKIDQDKVLNRLKNKKNGKYIIVTAITPTTLGEGKTTTTIGLVDGLAKFNKKVTTAIRQPSGGPTFNIKGSAAGGGLSQCIPLTDLSFGLTGDIDAISNAHNLSMVALTARMQHENNYSDEHLSKIGINRLNIDPEKIFQKWVIDFCAQSLRNITIGQGGRLDGYEMKSGFQITVSSEIMAILSIVKDFKELRDKIGKIVLAKNKEGKDVTTSDLEVAGAMTAWLVDTINPNLLQTMEDNPVFVHAGPFANIAIGQSSVISDILASKLSDYHVTESGFGADIGFEKFWNLKCRYSKLKPNAAVIVCTIRALKMHGGGPLVKPGKRLDEAYLKEDLKLVEKGCENLIAHIEIVKKANVPVVVCINSFPADTEKEVLLVKEIVKRYGVKAVLSKHWQFGGVGAKELAKEVINLCEEEREFKFLYRDDDKISEKIDIIAKNIYGAKGIEYNELAKDKLEKLEKDRSVKNFGICMVKTHLSLSDDPEIKGRPKDWNLKVEDFLLYKGANLIVPVAGKIKWMPGTSSNPAFRNIDVNVKNKEIIGLF
ncbi:MAG: formate--tetrahydrofolate ligase [Chlamydiae bacterium SM23_39]|nr:MAG: formate--tetrahydrofolate ligase [Chlamydiae bacterium SM23_39]